LASLFDSANGLGNGIFCERINQPDGKGVLSADFFRRSENLQRPCPAHNPRQPLRASPAGHESEGGTPMSEHGVWGSNAAMTGEGEVKSSAHAVASDRSVDRGRILLECAHQALTQTRELASGRPHNGADFGKIGACGKEVGVSRDDERARCTSQTCHRLDEREHAGPRQAVGVVLGYEAQEGDVRLLFDLERGVSWDRRHG
jgi:hypothetical protein